MLDVPLTQMGRSWGVEQEGAGEHALVEKSVLRSLDDGRGPTSLLRGSGWDPSQMMALLVFPHLPAVGPYAPLSMSWVLGGVGANKTETLKMGKSAQATIKVQSLLILKVLIR